MREAPIAAGGVRQPISSAAADVAYGPPSLIRVALCFGAVTWLLELAILSFRKFILGDVRVWNQEAVWMGAIVYALLFALAGVVLHAWAGSSPRRRSVGVFLLAMLGATSVALVLPALHPLAGLILGAGVGARTARWSRTGGSFAPFVRRALAPATLVIASAAVLAAGVPVARERWLLSRLPAAPAGAPNVLFIILDTVRAWNLGLYGYERPTTPELERFAQAGVTFDLALATSPYTLPSHFSAFSGLYPGAMEAIKRFEYDEVVPRGQPMLAEILADNGYATAGFVANLFYASAEFGLTRGFSRYEDFPITLGQFVLSTAPGRRITNNGRFRRLIDNDEILNRKSAARIVNDFLDWRSGVEGRPFFAFLNFYDAHEPYLPPEPFETQFVREAPEEGFLYDTDRVQRLNMRDISPAETRRQMDRYDGAIASLDHQLGRLFATLQDSNDLANTIVIVTSDHGEEFMEHGKMGHVQYMYMSLLHVPLLVVAPGRTPGGLRVVAPVSIADLPATVLDLAGLDRPDPLPGSSLARFWHAPPATDVPILAEADPGPVRKSVLDRGLHFIRNIDEPPELYDYRNDRLEQRNLANESAAQEDVRRLEALLDSLLRNQPLAPSAPSFRAPLDPSS